MKTFMGASLVFCMALLGLGSALKCYTCQGSIGSCTKTQDCTEPKNSCLMLKAKGGETYQQCIKYSDCDFKVLSPMFPQDSSFTFKCCNSDLCNGASTTSSSVPGLLVSFAVWWWCVVVYLVVML
ncbi:CD59 glycoprotein-like isoform X2 [Pygocentrus nattereri]|nr:CD59 glycoprotein-like isoform X2 [Pygocentrus nattereri]